MDKWIDASTGHRWIDGMDRIERIDRIDTIRFKKKHKLKYNKITKIDR
jgi:hypothetical protein